MKQFFLIVIIWIFFINIILQPVYADGNKTESRFFPRETNVYDKSGKKVGTKIESRFFPRETNVYDKSGKKVGTETKSRFFPRETNIYKKSSYDLLHEKKDEKLSKKSYHSDYSKDYVPIDECDEDDEDECDEY